MADDQDDVPGGDSGEEPDDQDGAAADEDAGEDEPGKRKLSRKKLIVIAAAAVLALVVAGGGAALFLTGDGGDSGTATVQLAGPPVFHDLPGVVADLKTGRCRAPYLKLQIVLEIPGDQVPTVQERETELMDAVQARIREFERQDLVGQGGADKLRQEILAVVNGLIAPARASGVLFKEFLLQ